MQAHLSRPASCIGRRCQSPHTLPRRGNGRLARMAPVVDNLDPARANSRGPGIAARAA